MRTSANKYSMSKVISGRKTKKLLVDNYFYTIRRKNILASVQGRSQTSEQDEVSFGSEPFFLGGGARSKPPLPLSPENVKSWDRDDFIYTR